MSTSEDSNSSVKNPYDNRSSSFSRAQRKYNSDFEYQFQGVKCIYNLPSPCQEAWREGTLDPGRRFFGCSQFKDPRKKCGFFLWADLPYPERAREVIQDLRSKLKRKDEEMHNIRVDLNFAERKMWVLNEECCILRKKNEEIAANLADLKKKDGGWKVKNVMIIVLVALLLVNLLK